MSASPTRPAAALSRFDLYRPIHKALRAFMSDTLVVVGGMDAADEHDVTVALDQARSLLATLAVHLKHENTLVHPAMEARRPGSAAQTAHDHLEHEHAFVELHVAIEAVAVAGGAERAALALDLYRRLAVFVAENLVHMQVEELENMAVLWSAYTDEELIAIERSIVSAVPPPVMATVARWMMRGLNHAERVGMLQGMRHGAPAPVFEGVLAIARETLSARAWHKLERALELPTAEAA